MAATLVLPALETTARRAAAIHDAWTSDPAMPGTAGTLDEAVRVLAIRAAVHEETGDETLAALPAPGVVELSARLLVQQFPEVHDVVNRTGHAVVDGAEGTRWQPGDYVHRVYVVAFGRAVGRHWPV